MNKKPDLNDRLIELLVDQATHGLDLSDKMELERYTEEDIASEAERLELAAAAADIASFEESSMPADVRDRLLVAAGRHMGETESHSASSQTIGPAVDRSRPAAGPNWREFILVLAAAACLAYVLFGANLVSAPELSPRDKMADLREYKESKVISLVPGPHPVGQSMEGDLVWNQELQEGYMRLKDLKVNDPTDYQYQLWIFESADQKVPIDGGVFDITSADDVIPIRPAVRVRDKPVLFAITMELPGGVPQSDRSRLPVIGPVEE